MNSWRTGLPAFRVVAFGQIISSFGNEISGFALTIWAFQKTGSVTALGLVLFFNIVPYLVTLPFAGPIVDRSNRRLMLMLTDISSFIYTLALLLLQISGALEVWHLYVGIALVGFTQAFQEPALVSTMSAMVSQEDFPKASGAMGLVDSTRSLGGPALGAILYPLIGLTGVLIVDILTFSAAFITLLFINVPQPPPPKLPLQIRWFEEASFGFRYIWARPSLFWLMICASLSNFAWGIGQAVQPALILARGDATTLAVVRTAVGIGGLIGGLAISVWGAPKRRILGVFAGIGVYGLSMVLLGLGQNVWVWSIAAAIGMMFLPLIGASAGAIWQRKVDPALQARIVASRRFVVFLATPIGTLAAGPLTDHLFTPGMRPGGMLEGIFGGIVGTGVGAGFALAMLLAGSWNLAIVLLAALSQKVMNVETTEPDFVAPVPAPSVTASSETMPVTA